LLEAHPAEQVNEGEDRRHVVATGWAREKKQWFYRRWYFSTSVFLDILRSFHSSFTCDYNKHGWNT